MALGINGKKVIAAGTVIATVDHEIVFSEEPRITATIRAEGSEFPGKSAPGSFDVSIPMIEAGRPFGYVKAENGSGLTVEAVVERITGLNGKLVYTIY